MKRTKQARRDAKHLFRLCLTNGVLDENRVREVVRRVGAARNRNRLAVLSELRRLVKFDSARHTATVESAVPLPAEVQTDIRARLSRAYGAGLSAAFVHRPALIGGIRIKVGSDVYDGSVKGRLAALAARF